MPAYLVGPQLALRDVLIARLALSNDVIFAVAYLGADAIATLEHALRKRLERARFALRVVFRASDLQTEPEAIDALIALSKVGAGRVEIRWSQLKKFHAKGYGVRASTKAPPSVIVGSANLTSGAIAVDSGELGVELSNSGLAEQAWDTLESFWSSARPVTPAWLKKYRRAYDRRKKKEQAALAEARRWARRMPSIRRTLALPALHKEALFIEQVYPPTSEEMDLVNRARDDAKSSAEIEFSSDWVWCERRDVALQISLDRNLLKLEWFSDDDHTLGVRHMTIARLTRRPIRVVDPQSGTPFWLLFYTPVRGTRVVLRRRDSDRNEARLKKHGLSWRSLANMGGYVRGRRPALLKALRSLGMRLK